MKLKIKNIAVLITIFTLLSCGGGSDSTPEVTPPPVPAPSAATLVFPENNTECNISEILSETESIVPFDWNVSENTDSYEIVVRNLNTNLIVARQTTSDPDAGVTLERGTPFSWTITSIAQGTNATANSDTFRFFNEGPGVENFAPFPAEAINPVRGSTIPTTSNVNLQWTGSDIDNDIVGFSVSFGTKEIPDTVVGTTNGNVTSFSVSINPNTTYFWRVMTTDNRNNSSQSEIFQFRVQ